MAKEQLDESHLIRLVLGGFDKLLQELMNWHAQSDLDEDTFVKIGLSMTKKLDAASTEPVGKLEERLRDQSRDQGVHRDHAYIARVGRINTLREHFVGKHFLTDVPEQVRFETHALFMDAVVRQSALSNIQPLREVTIDTAIIEMRMRHLFHYIGALAALKLHTNPIEMLYPFDY